MRVAIATDGLYVSPHFGRCGAYTLVDIEDGRIVKKEVVDNPGHAPGAIPQYLREQGANQIVCGGMGARAAELFAGMGIGMVTGVTGSVEETIGRLTAGTLAGGESLCTHEEGHGHGDCDHAHEEGHDHGDCGHAHG